MKEYLCSYEKVLSEQGVTENGLSSSDASERLTAHGPNKLAEGKKESLLHKFLGEISDPMIIILIAAAVVSGINSLLLRGILCRCNYYHGCCRH